MRSKVSPSHGMKKHVLFLATIMGLAIGFSPDAVAQKKASPAPVGCVDPVIRLQGDAIKQHYVSQGFKVYRDAMLNMESMMPFPVVVQLNRGQLYQIIYVGHPAATNHKMVLYDGADRQMDERIISRRHDSDPTNYIIYSFVPARTDMYMFTFMSRLKNEDMCGSLCIVAVESDKSGIRYTPYAP